MKNKIQFSALVVLLLVALVSFESKAQLELGVKAGLNFNSASVDAAQAGQSYNDVADTRTGYHFGGYAHIKLGPLGIQPEVYYSVQGADVTVDGAKGAINSNYVQVPILVRFNFLKMFNVHVGPQFGFVVSDDFDGVAEDLEGQTANSDFSIAAGVGVDLPFNLNVTARYVNGFTDVVEDAQASDIESMKNAMFQISVGYALIGR
ncbi:Outer membrane protein beta-barrel domain-containing protein [Reichenbachiella agariperforans]|uniref:Outer membrane protein beta-barrel domain-containing protein n=1 Tax=Reichenbachiella agariperforans TaxID=156994 RepID=A0A1M6T3Z7_REIAG|nr:porin family protein [Reichenbachiella agariperforans]SHK51715.1 Outer membrane protein beta-barrel domain-containing protein [Reichenbachiella agariperforans]